MRQVLLGIGQCPSTHMRATGIPSHLAVAKEVSELIERVKQFEKEMNDLKMYIKTEQHQVLARELTNELRKHFEIDGVSALTTHDLDQLKDTLVAHMRIEMENLTRHISTSTATNGGSNIDSEPIWKTWDWNDGLICHHVPPGWRFPDGLTTKTLWDLWWFGERSTGIRPYCKLKKHIDIPKEQHMQYTRAKKVMEYLNKLFVQMNALQGNSDIQSISIAESDRVFEKIHEKAIEELYAGTKESRVEEISYGRMYNVLCKFNQKQRGQINNNQ